MPISIQSSSDLQRPTWCPTGPVRNRCKYRQTWPTYQYTIALGCSSCCAIGTSGWLNYHNNVLFLGLGSRKLRTCFIFSSLRKLKRDLDIYDPKTWPETHRNPLNIHVKIQNLHLHISTNKLPSRFQKDNAVMWRHYSTYNEMIWLN